jgi:hypothetical protein
VISRITQDNRSWGEERIANELLLKLGVCSPRTVRKYMPQVAPGAPRGDQRWAVAHYNTARPHMSLGLGIPDPPKAHNGATDSTSPERRARSGTRDIGWTASRVRAERLSGDRPMVLQLS